MEADETERTEAVVNADGGIGDVFVLGGERMEMRDAYRLRQKQYSCSDTGYPAHPASTICRCWLHQVIGQLLRSLPDTEQSVGFRRLGQVQPAERHTGGSKDAR